MKKPAENYENLLKREFNQWNHYLTVGGQDPLWEDGVNMNLIRNHIIYYKNQIEETMKPDEYPDIYFKETPPEVDSDYMACADEIRLQAKQSLDTYLSDENYKYLASKVEGLNRRAIKETCILNVIGYAKGLQMAIEEDDLVSMRRHRDPLRYIESFEQCADKVKQFRHQVGEQLSFFDYGGERDDL